MNASKQSAVLRGAGIALVLIVMLLSCGFAAGKHGMSPLGWKADEELQDNAEDGATRARREEERRRASREIVCWGDSMTAGYGASEAYIDTPDDQYDASYQAYPEILEHFTHLRTYNFGVVGATSDEIVAMQAAPEPPEGAEFEHFDYAVAEEAQEHPGDILILEIGSNGGWDNDYDKLVEQYQQMISYAGVGDQYLIIGDTDDPGSSIADTEQGAIGQDRQHRDTQWEIALSKAFGYHFINMRRNILGFGLEYCGLEETDEDRELMKYGYISKQLRSDWTHFNSYGYYAKARVIYLRGRKMGFWD